MQTRDRVVDLRQAQFPASEPGHGSDMRDVCFIFQLLHRGAVAVDAVRILAMTLHYRKYIIRLHHFREYVRTAPDIVQALRYSAYLWQ